MSAPAGPGTSLRSRNGRAGICSRRALGAARRAAAGTRWARAGNARAEGRLGSRGWEVRVRRARAGRRQAARAGSRQAARAGSRQAGASTGRPGREGAGAQIGSGLRGLVLGDLVLDGLVLGWLVGVLGRPGRAVRLESCTARVVAARRGHGAGGREAVGRGVPPVRRCCRSVRPVPVAGRTARRLAVDCPRRLPMSVVTSRSQLRQVVSGTYCTSDQGWAADRTGGPRDL